MPQGTPILYKGGFDLVSSNIPQINNCNSKKCHAYIWNGEELPRRVGDPPICYQNDSAYMTEWRMGEEQHHTSYGPYWEPSAEGYLVKVSYTISLLERNSLIPNALMVDCYDFNNINDGFHLRSIFKTSDFCEQSSGFILYSTEVVRIDPSMKIEARTFALGGASYRLHQVRFDVVYD